MLSSKPKGVKSVCICQDPRRAYLLQRALVASIQGVVRARRIPVRVPVPRARRASHGFRCGRSHSAHRLASRKNEGGTQPDGRGRGEGVDPVRLCHPRHLPIGRYKRGLYSHTYSIYCRFFSVIPHGSGPDKNGPSDRVESFGFAQSVRSSGSLCGGRGFAIRSSSFIVLRESPR